MYPGFCQGNLSFGHFWGWGWIIGVFIVGLVIGIVMLIIWLVKRSGSRHEYVHAGHGVTISSPRDILQVRYARGEISRDDYLEILKDLD